MPRLALGLALILTACSLPAVPGIDYPPDLAEPVVSAAGRWHTATGLWPSARVRDRDRSGYCAPNFNRMGYFTRGEVGVCYRAFESVLGVFTVRDRVEWTLLHEFGHALGGEHHEASGVMRESIEDAEDCLTPGDLEAVCDAAPCKWRAPECVVLR